MNKIRRLYGLLMISAYLSSLGFALYYLAIDIPPVYLAGFVSFGLCVIYHVTAHVTNNLVPLFRLTIATATTAYYCQIFFTGGINSPAIFELINLPLLAFFYRPRKDRYILIVISLILVFSLFLLSYYGYTKDLLPEEMKLSHSFICYLYVFASVTIFSFMFRSAIAVKNEKLGNSMKQLQETTQRLVESEKMASLGMLSAGVAHEINNPLNFIKGGVENLEHELRTNKENIAIEDYIKVINEGLNRTEKIISSLSHFSRQTDTMDEVCSVHSILDNCIVMIQPKLIGKVNISRSFDNKIATVIGNEGKLHQAFLNILSNAIDAIQESGEVDLKTKVNEKSICIEISDNGEGISEENLGKIRDPFFTTKPIGKGTGLGLSITYRIIEDHGGTINISSQERKGTTFSILLPNHETHLSVSV